MEHWWWVVRYIELYGIADTSHSKPLFYFFFLIATSPDSVHIPTNFLVSVFIV